MSNVKYVRPELAAQLNVYKTIFDCICGEPQVKGMIDVTPTGLYGGINVVPVVITTQNVINASKAKRYLPMPNADDLSEENVSRYHAYVTRAVFYNFTGNTVEAMIGQIFKRKPVSKLPDLLSTLDANADGNFLSLEQMSKRAVRYTLPYSRCGILVDFPQTDSAVSVGDLRTGKIQPVFSLYAPWDIPNWRTEKRNGKVVLTLVVLREIVDEQSDEFEQTLSERFRVLKLLPSGEYIQEIWDQVQPATSRAKAKFNKAQTIIPKDANGNPLTEIMFTFIGGENNDADVDSPLIYDLAALNIAHYRNSADYEESCFLVGQPTPVLTGLPEQWVKDVLKGNVPLGSRAAIPLPAGADAKLLQADPNAMTKEAMEHKERQAVGIGAKLVQDKQIQRTATDALMESSSESSMLASVAVNVSAAFTRALKWAAVFVGASEDECQFELNTEFELMNMNADDQSKLVAAWMRGAICWEEMRNGLRKAGTATMEDAEAKKLIEQEQADLIATGAIADPFSNVTKPKPSSNPAGHQVTATKTAIKGPTQ